METALLIYGLCLLLLIIADGIWLGFVVKNFVKRHIGHLMGEKLRVGPVVFFYPLYALGITFLVVFPAFSGNLEVWKVFLSGCLLGVVAYGAYDLTNFATLKGWSFTMTVLDMAWGTLLTGSVSTITFCLTGIILKVI